MKEKAYYENVSVKNEVKLRKLLEQLPDFCKQFSLALSQPLPRVPESRMLTISAVFLTISAM